MEKFPSDLSLWKVLRQFESGTASQGKNINLTARGIAQTRGGATGSGQLYYEAPTLNIMGRELSTLVDFQKTLSQLGYNSGSVLIRLTFRKTERTLFEAMEEISKHFAESEEEENKSTAPPAANTDATTSTEPVASTDAVESKAQEPETGSEPVPTQTEPKEGDQQPASSSDAMDVDSDTRADPLQPVGIFRAPTGTTPAAALAPLDEADYTPSIAHAQLHQARLQQNSQNKRLLSDKELEAQAQAQEAKLAAVTSLVVKVRFPDNTSAQWSFGHEATGALLYKGVRSVMANETQKFRLVLPGSHTVIKDQEGPKNLLIHDYKLTKNVLVNFVWDDNVPAAIRKQPFLKGSAAQKATAVKVPEAPKEEADANERRPAVQSSKSGSGSNLGDEVAKKLPKWLKLGKK